MQDIAAVEVAPSQFRPAVTPWRLQARQLGCEAVQLILAEAEPEAAYAAARSLAEDIVHAVMEGLRVVHGRTFDPVLDRVGMRPSSAHDEASVLRLITDNPGATLAELALAFSGRHDANAMVGIQRALSSLASAGSIRYERHTFSRKNRYFPA
jgi:hypothetical protein